MEVEEEVERIDAAEVVESIYVVELEVYEVSKWKLIC